MTWWRWFARMRPRCPRCLTTWGSAGANLHNGLDQTRIDDGVRPGVRLPPIADALADHGITAGEGRHYLCAMKDICPDRLVGCSIDSPMMAFLAVTALHGAVARRGTVAGCAVHADGGGQSRARKVVQELTHHDFVGSRGLRERHRHGVDLRSAPEQRPEPAALVHPRRTAAGDRDLD